jgi:hypothetical protein
MDYYLDDNNAIQRLVEEWEKYGRIIIAYDYDDTVFDFHNKGRKYSDVISLLREAKTLGAYFVVFTACNEGQYEDISKYLLTENIPYDKINENLDFIPFTGRKVYYNILLDDRSGLSASYYQLQQTIKILKEKN